MTAGSPPASRRRGVVTRALRRVLLALLREELDEMRRGLGAHQDAIDAHRAEIDVHRAELGIQREAGETRRSEVAALDFRVGTLTTLATELQRGIRDLEAAAEALRRDTAERLDAVQQARLELQTHLETVAAQTAAEVAELRNALFAVREEFEAVRDLRVPALDTAVARLHEALGAVQLAVEELSFIRVTRLEAGAAEAAAALDAVQQAVESLSSQRLPRLEDDAQRMAGAVQQVQDALEELAAVRVAQLEGDSARLASHLQEAQAAIEAMRRQAIALLENEIGQLGAAARELQRELERLRDESLPAASRDLAALQAAFDGLQGDVLGVRDAQLPEVAAGLAVLQHGVSEVQHLGEELRDQRLPALAARCDAVLARLHEQTEVTAGLVDRLLAREPLRIETPPAVEAELPEALRRAHLAFADEFRGGREETMQRVGEHIDRLAGHQPVLDLGCGRGELLEALQRAGVEARGVDSDPAMVEACRRRGLTAMQGDAMGVLAAQPPGSLGAVTALHLFEHLPAGIWAGIVEAAAAALRDGGVLLVECPNPEALRVGANLFWIDPTHRAPVHRESLAFVMRALGFEMVENTLLHPFPPEQMLAAPDLPAELGAVAARLDALLSAPRDWLLVARKPPPPPV